MSAKNIAFVGSLHTGKSTLQNKTIELLGEEIKVKVNQNVSSQVIGEINDKYVDYFSTSIELDLSSALKRRIEVLSIDPDNYIVSDEWVLLELAKMMVKMSRLQEKINRNSQLLGPNGKPVMTADEGDLIIIQAAFQILINQVAMEKEFWDFLYYVPIQDLNDDILDESGIKPKDRLNQKELDLAIRSLIQQLQLNVVLLPVGKEESFRFLEGEKGKWTGQCKMN